jgi:pre-mRNA-splicing factor 18
MSRQSIPAAAGMEVLKRELQRKRQLLDADFGGRKIVRRDEIEAREIQRIREAERLQKQLRGSSEGSPRASSPFGSSPAFAARNDASRA